MLVKRSNAVVIDVYIAVGIEKRKEILVSGAMYNGVSIHDLPVLENHQAILVGALYLQHIKKNIKLSPRLTYCLFSLSFLLLTIE